MDESHRSISIRCGNGLSSNNMPCIRRQSATCCGKGGQPRSYIKTARPSALHAISRVPNRCSGCRGISTHLRDLCSLGTNPAQVNMGLFGHWGSFGTVYSDGTLKHHTC
jgi:hypothetical protein